MAPVISSMLSIEAPSRLRESRRRTNLWWMAGLTPLVVYEKTGAGRRRAAPVAGLASLACSALVLAHPHWLPAIAGGSA